MLGVNNHGTITNNSTGLYAGNVGSRRGWEADSRSHTATVLSRGQIQCSFHNVMIDSHFSIQCQVIPAILSLFLSIHVSIIYLYHLSTSYHLSIH